MEPKTLPLLLFFLISYFFVSSQTYTFDFSVSDQQFEGGVSDFGVEMSDSISSLF